MIDLEVLIESNPNASGDWFSIYASPAKCVTTQTFLYSRNVYPNTIAHTLRPSILYIVVTPVFLLYIEYSFTHCAMNASSSFNKNFLSLPLRLLSSSAA